MSCKQGSRTLLMPPDNLSRRACHKETETDISSTSFLWNIIRCLMTQKISSRYCYHYNCRSTYRSTRPTTSDSFLRMFHTVIRVLFLFFLLLLFFFTPSIAACVRTENPIRNSCNGKVTSLKSHVSLPWWPRARFNPWVGGSIPWNQTNNMHALWKGNETSLTWTPFWILGMKMKSLHLENVDSCLEVPLSCVFFSGQRHHGRRVTVVDVNRCLEQNALW